MIPAGTVRNPPETATTKLPTRSGRSLTIEPNAMMLEEAGYTSDAWYLRGTWDGLTTEPVWINGLCPYNQDYLRGYDNAAPGHRVGGQS